MTRLEKRALFTKFKVWEKATSRQFLVLIWWEWFDHRRFLAFFSNLKEGQSVFYAYKNAAKRDNPPSKD